MEVSDLPAMQVGKTYIIKIYQEQPLPDAAPHRQIRPASLGNEYTGKYMGTVVRDDTTMIEFRLDETRELFDDKEAPVIGSFHHWLIESITEVTT